MANEREQLNVINQMVTGLQADVTAKLDEVRAELSPEGQQAVDDIRTKLEQFAAQVANSGSGGTGGTTPPSDGTTPPSDGTTPPSDGTQPSEPLGPDNATDESGTPQSPSA